MFSSFKLCICQDPRIARTYAAQNTKKAHFLLVSLSPHTRSRPGAERIRQGEGRLSRSPKPAPERSDLTEKFQFRETHTDAEMKKLLTKSLSPQNIESLYIYIFVKVYRIYSSCDLYMCKFTDLQQLRLSCTRRISIQVQLQTDVVLSIFDARTTVHCLLQLTFCVTSKNTRYPQAHQVHEMFWKN